MVAKTHLQDLSNDVGMKSSGDDLADIRVSNLSTSAAVTGENEQNGSPSNSQSCVKGFLTVAPRTDEIETLMSLTLFMKKDASTEQKSLGCTAGSKYVSLLCSSVLTEFHRRRGLSFAWIIRRQRN